MADSTPSAKSTGSGVSRLTSSPASSTSSVVSVARSPKTRVVRIDDGFDFLGHTIVRRVKRGTSKTYVFTFPVGQGHAGHPGPDTRAHQEQINPVYGCGPRCCCGCPDRCGVGRTISGTAHQVATSSRSTITPG